jgi:hypothetical protein
MWKDGGYNLGSSISTINGLAKVTKPLLGVTNTAVYGDSTTPVDPFLRTDHAIFQSFSRLLHLRASCTALRKGSHVTRWADTNLVAFSRMYNGVEIFVTITYGTIGFTLTDLFVDNSINAGVGYRNALSSSSPTYYVNWVGGSKKLSLNGYYLQPQTVAVWIPTTSMTSNFNTTLGTFLCKDVTLNFAADENKSKGDGPTIIFGMSVLALSVIGAIVGVAVIAAAVIIGVNMRRAAKKRSFEDRGARLESGRLENEVRHSSTEMKSGPSTNYL